MILFSVKSEKTKDLNLIKRNNEKIFKSRVDFTLF